MAKKKLFLLDAMALIYRAHFAFINNPRISSKGVNTSALYGFTTTLLDILKREQPTHLAVATDISKQTFRHDDFPEYKAGRQDTPEDIKAAIPQVAELLKAMDIPFLGMDRWEADDIIGTIAKKAQKDGFEVYMMTPDKDFAQLVDDHIYHYKPSRPPKPAEIFDREKTLKKWEIKEIDQVRDILGLMGDKVDNIPGIPGVGEKSAIKLIRQFGSIEELVKHTDELKGKLKERVEAHKEAALLSKQLATINVNCPIDYKPDSWTVGEYKNDALQKVFSDYEFRTLGKRVFGDSFALSSPQKGESAGDQMDLFNTPAESTENEGEIKTLEDVKVDYQLCDSPEKRKKLIDSLSKANQFAFDTETSSLDPLSCELVGMSFCLEPNTAFYVPVNEEEEGWQKIISEFKAVLEDESKEIIGQNLKYDFKVMMRKGIRLKGQILDTMLAHYLIDPDGRHGMDVLSETYLHYRPVSIESLIGKKGKKQGSMKDLSPSDIKDYAAEDADITLKLWEVLQPELNEGKAKKVFKELECPLIPVLSDMELEGIRVDKDFLASYSKELEGELGETQEKIFNEAGEEFNLNSPKQMGEILFGKMELDPKAKKTRTGQYKTDEATLQKLSDRHAIVQFILDYRQISKLKSTYVDALPRLINEETGRVHTNFQQAVAATGRLSSTEPNLQNIPIRTERGRKVRAAFISRADDYQILSADYSQVELRLVASISGDEAMIEAFNSGKDIHTATAARVFGIADEEVSRDQRSQAKAVNFGIIYGQGAFGLAQSLGISRKDAKEIIDQYFDKYSGIRTYMDEIKETARQNGYVETLMGRRRYLRDINSANHTVRSFAERNAINAPIQGSAADLIKIAMIQIHAEMKKRDMKSRMMLQVHDELLFDAHRSEQEELQQLVTELMSNAMTLKVPLEVDSAFGQSWLEAH